MVVPKNTTEVLRGPSRLAIGIAVGALVMSSCGSAEEVAGDLNEGGLTLVEIDNTPEPANRLALSDTTTYTPTSPEVNIAEIANRNLLKTSAAEPATSEKADELGVDDNLDQIVGPAEAGQTAKAVAERTVEEPVMPDAPVHKVVMLGNSIAAGSGMDGAGFFDLLKNSIQATPGLESVEFSNRAIPGQTNGTVNAPIVDNPEFATMQQQIRTEYEGLGPEDLKGHAFVVNPSLIDAMLSSHLSDEELVENQMTVLQDIKTYLESKGAYVLLTPYIQISQEHWYSDTPASPERIIGLVEQLNAALTERYRIPVTDYQLDGDNISGGDPQYYDEHLYYPPEFPNGIADGIHLDREGNLQIGTALQSHLANIVLTSHSNSPQ